MKTSLMSFKVPRLIDVRDYHDFDEIKGLLAIQLEIGDIEIRELGCTPNTGDYIGIIFNKKNPPTYKEICKLVIADSFDESDELTWNGKLIK